MKEGVGSKDAFAKVHQPLEDGAVLIHLSSPERLYGERTPETSSLLSSKCWVFMPHGKHTESVALLRILDHYFCRRRCERIPFVASDFGGRFRSDSGNFSLDRILNTLTSRQALHDDDLHAEDIRRDTCVSHCP